MRESFLITLIIFKGSDIRLVFRVQPPLKLDFAQNVNNWARMPNLLESSE